MSELEIQDNLFIADLKEIVNSSRQFAYSAVNFAQVRQNWLIGQRIVLQEQNGNERAEYGKRTIEIASKSLTDEFGKGFSLTNIKNFRAFYLIFSDFQIGQAATDQFDLGNSQALPDQSKPLLPLLSWTHYERLLRVKDSVARNWYVNEAANQMWSYRTLDRNISSQYYYRLLQSPQKENVITEMKLKTADFENDKFEFIKNPIVAEFLGLSNNPDFTESQLENAILSHLQKFILELGKGYAFVSRQKHIGTDAGDYFIDLVFYNYILKCFLLIDLKTTQITHQDVGQMDMYVRMFDEMQRTEGDNPTIGLILCAETSKDIARYSILNDSKQLFAAKYLTYLPTEEQLRNEINQQKEIFRLQQMDKGEK